MSEKDPASQEKPKRSTQIEIGGHIGSIRFLDNGAPPYELRIDREGRWFHEGVEIVRDEIRNLFSRHLIRCADGGYCVRIGRDECPVVVEDAPFVVVRVTKTPSGRIMLLLKDGEMELLDARTIVIRDSHVPYCRVRNDLEARFSRPAYYQLANFIECDETENTYWLVIGDETVELQIV